MLLKKAHLNIDGSNPLYLSHSESRVMNKMIKNPRLSTAEYNGLIALREQLKALYMI